MQDQLAINISNLTKTYNKVNKTNGKYNSKSLLNFFIPKTHFEKFYALNDISLEIEKGTIVGIIGSNGAGKSTLLKILGRVIPPTIGTIKINGDVASVLDLGLGFHPDLTGRENLALSGSLLGINKEIFKTDINDIIDFSGINNFIDTPVKYYSSGMYVRLAFSIAIHTHADIFLFDEILSMGDLDFQIKIQNKIEDLTKQDKTILLISHNLTEISKYCTKTLLLDKGEIKAFGNTANIIEKYFEMIVDNKLIKEDNDLINFKHSITNAEINSINENNNYFKLLKGVIYTNSNVQNKYFHHESIIYIELEILKKEEDSIIDIGYNVNKLDSKFMASSTEISGGKKNRQIRKKGMYKITSFINKNTLNALQYRVDIHFVAYNKNNINEIETQLFKSIDKAFLFKTEFKNKDDIYNFNFNGPIRLTNNWEIVKSDEK